MREGLLPPAYRSVAFPVKALLVLPPLSSLSLLPLPALFYGFSPGYSPSVTFYLCTFATTVYLLVHLPTWVYAFWLFWIPSWTLYLRLYYWLKTNRRPTPIHPLSLSLYSYLSERKRAFTMLVYSFAFVATFCYLRYAFCWFSPLHYDGSCARHDPLCLLPSSSHRMPVYLPTITTTLVLTWVGSFATDFDTDRPSLRGGEKLHTLRYLPSFWVTCCLHYHLPTTPRYTGPPRLPAQPACVSSGFALVTTCLPWVLLWTFVATPPLAALPPCTCYYRLWYLPHYYYFGFCYYYFLLRLLRIPVHLYHCPLVHLPPDHHWVLTLFCVQRLYGPAITIVTTATFPTTVWLPTTLLPCIYFAICPHARFTFTCGFYHLPPLRFLPDRTTLPAIPVPAAYLTPRRTIPPPDPAFAV